MWKREDASTSVERSMISSDENCLEKEGGGGVSSSCKVSVVGTRVIKETT